MTAFEILNKLKGAGFSVSFDEDIILHGQGDLDDELRHLVEENKSELLYHLRTREYDRLTGEAGKLASYLNDSPAPLPGRESQLFKYEALVDRIAELQPHIDRYQESGLTRWYSEGWLLVHSEILNELIVVIRDPDVKLPAGARAYPVYLFKEVETLAGKNDQTICAANKVKKTFKGKIEAGGKK